MNINELTTDQLLGYQGMLATKKDAESIELLQRVEEVLVDRLAEIVENGDLKMDTQQEFEFLEKTTIEARTEISRTLLPRVLADHLKESYKEEMRPAIDLYKQTTGSADAKKMLEEIFKNNNQENVRKLNAFLRWMHKMGKQHTPAFPVIFVAKLCNLRPFMAADIVEFAYIFEDENELPSGQRIRTYFDEIESIDSILTEMNNCAALMAVEEYKSETARRGIAMAMMPAHRQKIRTLYEEG